MLNNSKKGIYRNLLIFKLRYILYWLNQTGDRFMNVFVRGTVETGAHVLHAKIKTDMAAGAGEFITEWRFAEIGEKEFMACMNVTDMEAMGAFMSSPEELQWDKDNGCEYTVYGMEEMTE